METAPWGDEATATMSRFSKRSWRAAMAPTPAEPTAPPSLRISPWRGRSPSRDTIVFDEKKAFRIRFGGSLNEKASRVLSFSGSLLYRGGKIAVFPPTLESDQGALEHLLVLDGLSTDGCAGVLL